MLWDSQRIQDDFTGPTYGAVNTEERSDIYSNTFILLVESVSFSKMNNYIK